MLTQALVAAENANRAKSSFLSNMSHEMRTPMNAIIGMTLIAKTSADAERKNYCLQKIEDASSHLLGVINDILDMSKIEANKFELSPAEFSFEKMLQKTVNVINFRVDEKRQTFHVRLDRSVPKTLIGDDQRLAQVITNLLSNAVKFTPENGTILLDARMESEAGGACVIRVDVTDTGIGVSEEQQKRLFSSFQQADSGISRKFGGTGLGLAISKNIVEMMNGRIWIESEPGKGSKFAFTVELRRGAENAEAGRARPLGEGVGWDSLRALVVDDASEIREYFAEIASRLGFSCDVAASGRDALRMIEANGQYDMYFVDWKMPGMDGIELSKQIRPQRKDKSVVIMISSTEWSAIEDDARGAGVNSFLPKPLFPSAIADCVSEYLGVGGAQPEQGALPDMGAKFAGRRLLLAEDMEINREILMSLLEPTELAIECAENGREAVEMFAARPGGFDMIFMDVQMPEMDGYEATRRIRALPAPEASTIPIVAMTANVFREDVEKCLECGMNAHVGKPIDLEEVLDRLAQYLA
ncbi:MAG: response regulator [Clostridiales bacterium]|nr:response regulator [Clostridiales bacterium]